MSWDQFVIFAIVALLCWGIGAVAAWRGKRQWMIYTATLAGLAVFFAFILGMWISLERPPMRTMGETRLWYSFFLPLAGIITYSRWRYKWILSFSFILSLVFVCINLFKPEIHNKTLMPALQSPWFAPHVIVYMFAYAMLGAAAVMAVYLLWIKKKTPAEREKLLHLMSSLELNYKDRKEVNRAMSYFGESFINGPELVQFALTILNFDFEAEQKQVVAQLQKLLDNNTCTSPTERS